MSAFGGNADCRFALQMSANDPYGHHPHFQRYFDPIRCGAMKRREFITLIGGAVGWPLVARAQPSRAPVVGWLHSASAGFTVPLIAAFRKGLSESGFTEHQNVSIEYRYANGQYERLSALAGEL